jgi:Calcium-activated chloride channel
MYTTNNLHSMALWATMFLEFWKRHNAATALRWGVIGAENEEELKVSLDYFKPYNFNTIEVVINTTKVLFYSSRIVNEAKRISILTRYRVAWHSYLPSNSFSCGGTHLHPCCFSPVKVACTYAYTSMHTDDLHCLYALCALVCACYAKQDLVERAGKSQASPMSKYLLTVPATCLAIYACIRAMLYCIRLSDVAESR